MVAVNRTFEFSNFNKPYKAGLSTIHDRFGQHAVGKSSSVVSMYHFNHLLRF